YRNVTGVQTCALPISCGIVPKIYQLALEHFSITLAISLHAPNDESRKRLMPVANRYTIGEIMEACRVYFKETGRRISFEYSLVRSEERRVGKGGRTGR